MAKSKNINIKWTLEEESFLINNYSNKSWGYILNQLPRHNKKQIIDKASYMKIKRERVWSFEDITILKKIYEKSPSVDSVVDYFNGKYTKKQIIKKANRMGLKNRNKLTKTLKNIDEYIRTNNTEWKEKSLQYCKYRCVFTGSNNIHIHHIYPFHKILYESFEELGYDLNCEYELTDIEVKEICTHFYEKQNQYGYGVCIDKCIHNLFHSVYGYKNFTVDNWNEFKNDLLKGKYNKILYENEVNINLLSKNMVKK